MKFNVLRINLPFKYHGRDLNLSVQKAQIPVGRCLCGAIYSDFDQFKHLRMANMCAR